MIEKIAVKKTNKIFIKIRIRPDAACQLHIKF